MHKNFQEYFILKAIKWSPDVIRNCIVYTCFLIFKLKERLNSTNFRLLVQKYSPRILKIVVFDSTKSSAYCLISRKSSVIHTQETMSEVSSGCHENNIEYTAFNNCCYSPYDGYVSGNIAITTGYFSCFLLQCSFFKSVFSFL